MKRAALGVVCIMAIGACGGSSSSKTDAGQDAGGRTDDSGTPSDGGAAGEDGGPGLGDGGDLSLEALACVNALFEISYVILDSIDLEGTGGTCPQHEREGAGANQTLTLTWGEDCDWSGTIVIEIERTGVGQGNMAVSFDDLDADGTNVTGSISGSYVITGSEISASLTITDLVLSGATSCEIDGTGTASVDDADLVFDGNLTIDDVAFVVDEVRIAIVELAETCVLPYAGTISYAPAAGPTVTVSFDESSPSDGTVDVSVGDVTYDDVPYCSYVYP